MAKIQPKLGVSGSEHELTDGVSKLEFWFEEVKERHKLHDGSAKFLHKGYKFHSRLTFDLMSKTDYDGLLAEYNRNTELNFIPNPQEYPDSDFEVRWTNAFNFVLATRTRIEYFRGMIVLEGTEILSSIPAWVNS